MVPTAAPTRARGLAESERIAAQLLEEQNQGSVKVPPSTVIKSCGRHPDYHRCGESWSPDVVAALIALADEGALSA
jgi:hypothetical protein